MKKLLENKFYLNLTVIGLIVLSFACMCLPIMNFPSNYASSDNYVSMFNAIHYGFWSTDWQKYTCKTLDWGYWLLVSALVLVVLVTILEKTVKSKYMPMVKFVLLIIACVLIFIASLLFWLSYLEFDKSGGPSIKNKSQGFYGCGCYITGFVSLVAFIMCVYNAYKSKPTETYIY